MSEVEKDKKISILKKKIAIFVNNLRKCLKSIPASSKFKITDQEWAASASIDVPLIQKPFNVHGYFQFESPSKVFAVGSIMYDTLLENNSMIDICLLPSKTFYQDKDYLNHRYFRKRALFLTWIAFQLRDNHSDLVKNLRFSFDFHPMRPVLLLNSTQKSLKFDFRLLLGASEFIRPERFLPTQNNVRPHWYNNSTKSPETDSYLATPFYNSMILHDLNLVSSHLLLKEHIGSEKNVKECIKLVKIWCNRKGFQKILNFPLSIFVIYLFKKNILKPKMNVIQMFRQTLLAFSESKWDSEPLFFSENKPKNLEDFKNGHDVVFLNETNHYNLCYQLSKDLYEGAKIEASLTLQVLHTDCEDSLPKSLTSINFNDKFDIQLIIDIKSFKEARGLVDKIENDIIDHCGQTHCVFIKYIIFLLNKGLSKRIKLIQQDLSWFNEYEWSVNEDHLLSAQKCEYIKLGILLDPEGMLDVIEKGPSADLEIAKNFRNFWKSKSELRRFQDGSICETVHWSANSLSERRAIIAKAIKHILKEHLNIKRSLMKITGAEIDFLLYLSKTDEFHYGTGEEKIRDVINCFDRFAKNVKKLKDLSHTISSLQGISPIFRGSEVFPPKMDIPITYSPKNYTLIENCFAFSLNAQNASFPHWFEPLDVIANLEVGGKWPNDLQALEKARTLYYLDLSEALFSQLSIYSKPSLQYLDVFFEGLVFRIHLDLTKTINLMMYKVNDKTKQLKVESEVEKLQFFSQLMPIVTTSLNAINRKFVAYNCSVRMAKRWLTCHLLGDHLNEILIDLIAAFVFLHPYPYSAPQSPVVGFLRILWTIANYNWNKKALIINFNEELTSEEILNMQKEFIENRAKFSAMTILTPYNKTSSYWTKEQPIAPIFSRLIKLAQATYITFHSQLNNIFKSNFMVLFVPLINIYHMSINLKKIYISNFHLNLNFTKHFSPIQPSVTSDLSISSSGMPIVDFNPIHLFVEKLKKLYSKYALFFYDKYGGYRIFVIWKPNIFDSRPLIYRQVLDSKLTGTLADDGRPNITLNFDALIEDIQLLGEGLIDKIEILNEKWS